MTAIEVLHELTRRGVTLRVEDSKILAKPLSAVDDDLRREAQAHKAEIIRLLTGSTGTPVDEAEELKRAWHEARQRFRDAQGDEETDKAWTEWLEFDDRLYAELGPDGYEEWSGRREMKRGERWAD